MLWAHLAKVGSRALPHLMTSMLSHLISILFFCHCFAQSLSATTMFRKTLKNYKYRCNKPYVTGTLGQGGFSGLTRPNDLHVIASDFNSFFCHCFAQSLSATTMFSKNLKTIIKIRKK